jgi:hypothetical protein
MVIKHLAILLIFYFFVKLSGYKDKFFNPLSVICFHQIVNRLLVGMVGGLWLRLGKIKCAAIWVGLCVGIAALLILRSVSIFLSVVSKNVNV